ncbi:hypothetical protein SAMN04488587_0972 [Methanococcoides vulcani]|uniref:Uncharacterized protein n=1 Tax=Methanococcoides vulcani TaxID=1353158 RepID=A0A1H9ZAA9_9EURY|nr:hypothetical protein [Methanococcoides vulcani]SES78458.1 hypothetical protein SAMN04488587_0972 [Methanococcoides vulcani]
MLDERHTYKSHDSDGKEVIDPYHINEFNDVIMKIASLKDKDLRISRGIDTITTKVCNTAIRLAKDDHEMPLDRIDQAIALNFASSEQVEHDINRIISEKMNLGQMFRYPETFRYDQIRKKDLVPRKVPEEKKLGININYAIEALYAQENSADQWNIIVNHEWFELSTEPIFDLMPEMLPSNSEYDTTAGVVNILHFFDMDSIRREWSGPVDLFYQGCVDTLMEHTVAEIEVPDENGLSHTYKIEWIDE